MQRFARLVALFVVLLIARGVARAEEGFKPIFDGKTLQGWEGDPKLWRVEEGAITGQTTADNPAKGNTFLIWRGGKPADFELKIEFRMPDAGFANSGVQYRSREEPKKVGRWVVGGYQADMDGENQYTGILYDERGRGILASRGQKTIVGADHRPKLAQQFGDSNEVAKAIKNHQWNEYHIIARGNHLVQKINGRLMIDVTDNDPKKQKLEGILALQIHAGPPMKVQFRNIRLKELPRQTPPAKGDADKKKIVFIAGKPSHGYAEHEYGPGCVLLAKCLKEGLPNVETVVCKNGWPKDAKALDGASAIVVFTDGATSNPILQHLNEVRKLMKQGVGLACIHWSLDIPKGKPGDLLKGWIGGYFEQSWSVNPFWTAEFKQMPDHPITRGVKPFSIEDEWYYHMRFLDGMQGVTPILTAVPPDKTREGPDGPYSGNPTVRSQKGSPEHLAWARQRPDGGRGFGFTGGHWHWNWANDGFRTIVLNGIAWTAKLDVPPGGVPSKTPTSEELEANQDKPQPPGFDREGIRKKIEAWK